MAPICVQLVKDVLRLLKGIGWPARGNWWPGHFIPDAVMPADDRGRRLALTGYRRDRRESSAGRLRWLRSLGRSPQRNSSHRQ
jgi:hypothetical protein